MDIFGSIERLEAFYLKLHEDFEQVCAKFPELRTDLQAFLSGRIAQLAADNREADRAQIDSQATALRTEFYTLAEQKAAALLSLHEKKLAEFHTFAREIVTAQVREVAARSDSQLSTLNTQLRELAAQQPALASTPGDPTAPLTPTTINLLAAFRGQWTPKLTLRTGELVTFRGSVLLAKRDVPAGTVPNSQNQRGPSAYFALFVPAGAPGPKGIDGLSTAQLVSAPATATSAGVAGTFAYAAGYLYVCHATNTWRRTPLASW